MTERIIFDKTIDHVDHYLQYGEGEELEGESFYTYDEEGKILQVETTNDLLEKTYVTVYKYDEYGNWVSLEQHDGDGELQMKQEREYEKRTVKELFQKAF